MAKTDNFQDFVKDIANALRIRYNTTDTYTPNEFCNKILELSGLTDCNELHYVEVVYYVNDINEEIRLFKNLSGYTDFYIDDERIENPQQYHKFSSYGKHYIDIYGLTEIPDECFEHCHNIIAVSLSNEITKIGVNAFYHCGDMDTILMSDNLTEIGEYAFGYCVSLKNIEISKNCSEIKKYAFYQCDALEEIICRGETAPTIYKETFMDINENGILYHSENTDYSSWLKTDEYYLGHYNWTDKILYKHVDITSVQQYVTHLADIIRKAKRYGKSVLINPQDFYYHILSTNLEYINGEKCIPGDIAVHCAYDDKIHIIHQDYYRQDLFPTEYYTPIGSVVVPFGHTDDNTIRIMSLRGMDCENPESGKLGMPGMWFGEDGSIDNLTPINSFKYSSNPFNTSASSLSTSACTLSGDATGRTESVLGHFDETFCYMTGATVENLHYHSSTSVKVPMPYLSDGITRNDAYYSGIFGDMDGRGNTDKILAKRGERDYASWIPNGASAEDYPAASCCDMFHTKGTKQGDWYLPSMGELGHLIPYLKRIHKGILLMGGIGLCKEYYDMWSSTVVNDDLAWSIDLPVGGLLAAYKQYGESGAYAFLSLDVDSVIYQGGHNINEDDIENFNDYADVAIYDSNLDEILFVHGKHLDKYKNSNNVYPIGIVAVPESHNVYGDNSVGVLSLKYMDSSQPEMGNTSAVKLYWGTNANIETLNDYNVANTYGKLSAATSTNVTTTTYTKIPSDKWGVLSTSALSFDNSSLYYSGNSSSYVGPSPYNEDWSRNEKYYTTSASSANCLSDFDGKGNSEKILAVRGEKEYLTWKPTENVGEDYPAVSCCDMYHTEGTKQGDWYLPSIGELGYVMARYNYINNSLNKVKDVFGDEYAGQLTNNVIWSSTEFDTNMSRCLTLRSGDVTQFSKNESLIAVRAFTKLTYGGIYKPLLENTLDVLIYDSVTDTKFLVKGDELNNYSNLHRYSPIGIEIIPTEHDVYGDGSCGILSLKEMSLETPSEGSNNYELISWGQANIDTSLKNYTTVVYCGANGTVIDSVGVENAYSYLPSDREDFNVVENPFDTDTSYIYTDKCYAPSPYRTDDSRNANYYNTAMSSENCLSDFNGKENTAHLVTLHTIDDLTTATTITNGSGDTAAPAAACCYLYHTEGTNKGDWYLPAIGELGYVMPKWNELSNTIYNINTIYTNQKSNMLFETDRYWTSTEYSNLYARRINTENGGIYFNAKESNHYVRALMRFKP